MAKSTKVWCLIIGVFSILVFIGLYHKSLIKAYVDNIKTNHFKTGDKMYPNPKITSLIPNTEINLLRLVKNADSHYETVYINSLSNDSLLKHQTDFLGTYVDYKIIPMGYHGQNIFVKLYAIIPNPLVIEKPNVKFKIPDGYRLIDSNFYILANEPRIKM